MADIEKTKAVMTSLVQMKPKPHEEMRVGKHQGKTVKSPQKKRASSKPKTSS